MGIPDNKTCTRCEQSKSLALFGNEKNGKYGKASRCKECMKIYAKEYKAREGKAEMYAKLNAASYLRRRDAKRVESGWTPKEVPTTEKMCSICGEVKPLSDYHNDKSSPTGKGYYCKICAIKKTCAYSKNNREILRSKEAVRREKNRVSVRAAASRCWAKNKHNPYFRMKAWMRSSLNRVLRDKGSKRTCDILGYSHDELVQHIQAQFLRGMTWDNYGKWHIDHIVPLSSFSITDKNDKNIRIACALTNLRPLWAKDNLRKSAKREFLI